MLCSNLLCFDSDFAVFGILFSCLRLQECSFSPGNVCFLKWSIVFGWFGVWSVACVLNGVFVVSFVFSCFVCLVFFSILLFFLILGFKKKLLTEHI